MPEPAISAPSKNTGSFASFLASFTGPAPEPDDDWDLSGLADDVATISYEEALRAHRPVRSSEYATQTLPENRPTSAADPPPAKRAKAGEKKGRTASITLRLTEAEHTQLQQRATEAKLSVSAYIRSCIFEAESLRTQVKEALAQIQTASLLPTSTVPVDGPARDRQIRFLPRWLRRHDADSDC